jgi:hypothetical protein
VKVVKINFAFEALEALVHVDGTVVSDSTNGAAALTNITWFATLWAPFQPV